MRVKKSSHKLLTLFLSLLLICGSGQMLNTVVFAGSVEPFGAEFVVGFSLSFPNLYNPVPESALKPAGCTNHYKRTL